MERVRALADVGGVDRALWRELADAGVFSLRLPEDDGGAGLGMAEAALVFEELGRALVPGPLVWTHLAAGLVPGAAEGERVVGGLQRQEEPFLVEYPDVIDVLLAVDDDGLWEVDRSRLSARPVSWPLDPLTPVHVAGGGRLRLPASGGDSISLAGASHTYPSEVYDTVTHSDFEYVRGDVSTNTVESVWSLFKRSIIGAFHKISVKHLDAYLQEQEFRINNRHNQHAFRDVMKRILTTDPLRYSTLTASKET